MLADYEAVFESRTLQQSQGLDAFRFLFKLNTSRTNFLHGVRWSFFWGGAAGKVLKLTCAMRVTGPGDYKGRGTMNWSQV